MMKKEVLFDKNYYQTIMKEFGYNPIEFEPISFSLGSFSKEDLQKNWLCHMNGENFSASYKTGRSTIVTTGFGISGEPHMGTLSQILRAIRLQKNGMNVQIVLGDLDAYNGKNIPLEKTLELSEKYKNFIRKLGFQENEHSILRNQFDSLNTLRTSYLIGHHMTDEMFDASEEDLHDFYSEQNKVDPTMSYRRKLSLNLMVADFLELFRSYDSILIMLGIDEHKYVNFGNQVLKSLSSEDSKYQNKDYTAIYSGIISGFNGYPKMSKSFPDSGIAVDMSSEKIRDIIMSKGNETQFPETDVVYQLISSVSLYDAPRISEAYEECKSRTEKWKLLKREYIEHLLWLCSKWSEV